MQTMESFENPSKLSILRGRGIRSIIVGHASRSSSSDTLFQITSPLTEKRSPSRITDRSSGNSRRLSRYVLCLDFRNENGVTVRGAITLPIYTGCLDYIRPKSYQRSKFNPEERQVRGIHEKYVDTFL